MSALQTALDAAHDWPVDTAAAAVVADDGRVIATTGDTARRFPLASVTKPLSAYGFLLAIEEGGIALDQPAGPEGARVRHLLAHTGGYDFGSRKVLAEPGTRRIYSNAGFEVLAELLETESGIAFPDYLREGVFGPLGMSDTALEGSAGAGAVSTVDDLARFAAELQAPTILAPETLADATEVAFPGLRGVLPGFGTQPDNAWGLGFEIRDHKSPHWMGSRNSPAAFGHFGQSGTFLWVDPSASAALIALTDRDFGPWAAEVWPPFSDGVLGALGES